MEGLFDYKHNEKYKIKEKIYYLTNYLFYVFNYKLN